MSDSSASTITKMDIAALKKADRVSFDHTSGKGVIRCTKRGKPPYGDETSVEISAVSSSVYVYGTDDNTPSKTDTARCFTMIYASSPILQTIISLLKEGDRIMLDWRGSDNNGYVKASRITNETESDSVGPWNIGEKIYHDKLYIVIIRKGKTKYTLYMDDSICPMNSARMIQY